VRKWTILFGGALLVTAPSGRGETVYYFFTPAAPGPRSARSVAEYLRDTPGVVLRPCLMIESWNTPGQTDAEFLDACRSLAGKEGISVYDPEALALARRFGIRRVPAIVRVRGDRVHFCYGADVTRKEMESCSR